MQKIKEKQGDLKAIGQFFMGKTLMNQPLSLHVVCMALN